MDRHQALLSWVKNELNDPKCYVKPASNDASFRSYWRAFSQVNTYIVMDAPPNHEDCIPFIEISKKLALTGVQVPIVIAKDLTQGFLLLTDLGTVQYLDILDNDNYIKLYQAAIESLLIIQQRASQINIPEYNKQLLQQELNLFGDWFVNKHLDIVLSVEQDKVIQEVQSLLINNAIEQPQSFVLRDYHSRNLMKTKDNNPGILDFQDAVIGPVTYDLVSLLKDCYVLWDENTINNLSDQFRQKFNALNSTEISTNQWQRWFDLMGLQRHLKVVGIFCRLNYRDNKPNYLKDLKLTLFYITQVCKKYEELTPLLTLINEITPSMDKIC